MIYRLIHADVVEGLRELADCSIDAAVTDPPYELGFMGKPWDSSGIANSVPMWREVLRVLKPGGHLLSFGGSRTYHRMACAIEDAGFAIRDQLQWLYGSGFPKSLDVSKAVDRHLGAEPRVVGSRKVVKGVAFEQSSPYAAGKEEIPITEAATAAAAALQGWGTALKPAHEPIVLARKPLIGNVAANVLQHGTGALNIDGCRIETGDDLNGGAYAKIGGRSVSASLHAESGMNQPGKTTGRDFATPAGRWPANVILDEEGAALLDEMTGELTSGVYSGKRNAPKTKNTFGKFELRDEAPASYGDTGGPSRFFYTAKAGRSEREEGLFGSDAEYEHSGPRGHSANGDGTPRPRPRPRQNHHPTVKPVDVMRWLVRLVTPPGGTVLDPFTGSGTTGMAAIAESMNFIGIEREAEYVEIARHRIASIAPMFAKEASEPFALGTEQGGEE